LGGDLFGFFQGGAMTTIYNLRAANNCTFRWTRDLSSFASLYDIPAATFRMQARTSPFAPDPPVYEWNSTNTSGGSAYFDPSTNLVVISAPEADMARMQTNLVYDCRLEIAGGESIILFGGKIVWTPGVTHMSGDVSATGASGVGDTVSVDGESSSSPVPIPLSLSAALTAAQAAAASAQAAAFISALIYG
jgi:hypothetical protein